MSNKTETNIMKQDAKRELKPNLRFPEFRDAPGWKSIPLSDVSVPVVERVGDRILTPVSISAGIGFVRQAEKFGRDISGDQYKLYTLVKDGDFVYNKGNSLKFPQGCVYPLQGWGEVAVPNVFICFRLKEGYSNALFQNFFERNFHGLQLKRHITSSARSNGLLNISKECFFGVELPVPSIPEQQRVAECLTSLDELIADHGDKLDALKAHKKGLMQQLFPREGETLPCLRFPEFQDSGEWRYKTLNDIAEISSGTTPSRSNPEFFNGGTIPWVKTMDLNNSFIMETEEKITPKARARVNPAGSVLVAMYGGFNQIGRTGCLSVPAATNQAISVLVVDNKVALPVYVLAWLNAKVEDWKRIASSSRKDPNITGSDVANFPISYPKIQEQQKIADTLSSLDDLISAQTQKLEALKGHKKGMMQQLFPSPQEVEG
jgi:type I restriction enzyme, S subunit